MSASYPEITIDLNFDRYIGQDDTLDMLQDALLRLAPKWAEKLHLWYYKSPLHKKPVNVKQAGALREAVFAASQKGPLFRWLMENRKELVLHERFTGGAEFHGASKGLGVIVSIDEAPFVRMHDGKLLLGHNSISLQVFGRVRRESLSVQKWELLVFRDLCPCTRPAWGAIYHDAEYHAKVMSDGPSVRAIGVDFARYLPGIFTANYFGPRYVELIGQQRLLSAPSVASAEVVGEGMLLVLDEDPYTWDTPERKVLEDAVLDHLGRQYFFSKTHPVAEPVAPQWPQPQ